MIAVRLADGSTLYGFGRRSVVARNAAGLPDPYWQQLAEASLAGGDDDILSGLMRLPGATLVHHGAVVAGAAPPSGMPASEERKLRRRARP